MVTVASLLEERQVLVGEAKDVLGEAEGHPVGSDERAELETKFDAMMADADGLAEKAEYLRKSETREKRLAEATEGGEDAERREESLRTRKMIRADGSETDPDADEVEKRQLHLTVFSSWLRRGHASVIEPDHLRILQEEVDSQGGFLVPEDMRNEMIRKIATSTVVRANGARVINTSRDRVVVPKLTGGDDNFTSAVDIVWADELLGEDEGLTEPGFGQVTAEVHKMLAKTRISKDLLDDSAIDIVSLLTDLYAEAFALREDEAFLIGNGIKKPVGIFTDPANDITQVNSGDAATVTADGLIDLAYSLPQQYRANAKFIMRQTTEREIRKLKDGNGQYLWQPGLQAGTPGVILGWEILGSEFVPAIAASAEPIFFGQLSGYWIIDRAGMTMQRLNERHAEIGQVGFVVDKRVGGLVTHPFQMRLQTISA